MKKRVVEYILLTICGLLLFSAVNEAESVRRGYAAIGGEGIFILLPLLWWIVKTTVKDAIRTLKMLKNNWREE